MKRCMKGKLAAGLAAAAGLSVILSGCGTGEDNGKVTIEIIQSKPRRPLTSIRWKRSSTQPMMTLS